MSDNGASPTGQTVDGITIDANRITRSEFVRLTRELEKAGDAEDLETAEQISGTLVEKLVTDWPFPAEINQAGYLSLGMLDAVRVDEAIREVMDGIRKKKSGRRSTSRAGTKKK